jgi:two-component system sensor histidine kinase DegS
MRGQLEKLQNNQRSLSRYLDLLRGVLEITGSAQYETQVVESEGGEGAARPLIVRIINAQEKERQRLSRQMHDGPAQSLTNLILQAEICERLFDTDPNRAKTELVTLKNAVSTTFQKVKGFILNLRPMMLDDLGVVPTLRRYVDSFTDNSGVLTNLTVTGKERRLESYQEVTTFRLIQELLNNAADYGHASNIQISLDMGDELIRVSVEDNGTGFELTEALTSPDADQLGLATMRERVEMLGGRIHFDSSLGRGTRIGFELPTA